VQQGLDVETVNPISRNLEVTVQTLYSPRVYALGAAYDWDRSWTSTVEVSVVDWSSYQPPFAPPMDIHQVGAPANLCVAKNNECIRNQPQEIAAINSTMVKLSPVVVPRVATRWQSRWGLHLEGGYAFIPTPVPEQTSITNILDANKHVVGLGGGYARSFGKSLLRADLGLQLQLMQTRRFRKDGNDPLIEAYSRAASGVDRDPSFAPNPLAPDPRAPPEVEIWGMSLALAVSLAYDYTL
jgi:long-subunit fatty acid transport protein